VRRAEPASPAVNRPGTPALPAEEDMGEASSSLPRRLQRALCL
jgi:hypothetical protein